MADWSRSRPSENVEIRSPYDPRDYGVRAMGLLEGLFGRGVKEDIGENNMADALAAAEEASRTGSLKDFVDAYMGASGWGRQEPISSDPFMSEMSNRLAGEVPGETYDPVTGAVMASSPTPAASRTTSASNPLADRGWTDRDYAAAIGTLAGEAATKGSLKDYQAIADVIANRLEDRNFASQYGRSVASQALNPKEFSAWDKSQKEAYRNAVTSFNAALNPKLEAKLPSALQERVSLAKQAVDDVFNTQVARGITMGSTFYDNPKVTASLGTGGFHNGLESQYGGIIIGDHRFTGPGFNPDAPEVDVDANRVQRGVGMPDLPGALSGLNTPDFNLPSVPDVPDPMRSLTPEGMIAPGNINLAERPTVLNDDGSISTVRSMSINVDGHEVLIPTVALDGSRILSDEEAIQQFQQTGQHLGVFDTPDAATAYAEGLHQDQEALYSGRGLNPPDAPDLASILNDIQSAGIPPDFSGITQDIPGFDPFAGFSPNVPSTPDVMGQFDGPTYPDMSAGLYDGAAPASDVSVPSPPDVGGLSGLDAYGPAMSEAGYASPSHTGFDAGSFQTPDFNAPTQQARDRIANFESRNFVGLNAPDFEGMARDLTAEITGKPQMEATYRDVPVFGKPNSLQEAVQAAIDDQHPRAAKAPEVAAPIQIGTRREFTGYKPAAAPAVQPKALPSMPPAREVPAAPALSSSFASAPPGLGDQFGMGLHGFEGFLGAMNARDPAAMNAINNAGMGYAANYAMGDGPYATMGTNDLQDRFGSQFGMDGRKSIAEGFKHDYGQLSPTARGGIEGAMKGLAMGGPLGMLGGGAWGAFSGYAMPNGIMGTLGSMFDGTFGGGFESGTPGNMSNYGSPYDGAGLAGPYDSLFSGAPGAAGNMHDMQAIQDAYDARNSGGGMFGGGGGWGHDPSEDGGARYS